MKIYIPTYGRVDRQNTLNNLPKQLRNITTLVVQKREEKLHSHPNLLVLPDSIRTIAPTRQFILDNAYKKDIKKLVMLDDDMRFDVRRTDEPEKFRAPTDADIMQMFKAIEKSLDTYAHAGVLSREGGNRVTDATRENTRMVRVLAYRVDTFKRSKATFDRGILNKEDFDVTLQLLRAGHKNLVHCRWVHNQGSSNSSGGCSEQRTTATQEADSRLLQEFHPGLVKLVEKQTKTAWNGLPRLDVVIQWKKAYESSQGRK